VADYFFKGEKIECLSANVYSKKITPSVPQNHPKIGLSLKYNCERDGSAEIIKELSPKKAKINEASHLNLNDKLSANSLYCLVKGIKPITKTKIGGHTGRHSTQFMKTDDFTFSEISKPFLHIQNALEKRISGKKPT
jgi:hypothetical protein